jgi:hypothetical protein
MPTDTEQRVLQKERPMLSVRLSHPINDDFGTDPEMKKRAFLAATTRRVFCLVKRLRIRAAE